MTQSTASVTSGSASSSRGHQPIPEGSQGQGRCGACGLAGATSGRPVRSGAGVAGGQLTSSLGLGRRGGVVPAWVGCGHHLATPSLRAGLSCPTARVALVTPPHVATPTCLRDDVSAQVQLLPRRGPSSTEVEGAAVTAASLPRRPGFPLRHSTVAPPRVSLGEGLAPPQLSLSAFPCHPLPRAAKRSARPGHEPDGPGPSAPRIPRCNPRTRWTSIGPSVAPDRSTVRPRNRYQANLRCTLSAVREGSPFRRCSISPFSPTLDLLQTPGRPGFCTLCPGLSDHVRGAGRTS